MKILRRTTSLLLTIAVAVVLSACSGSGTPAAPTTGPAVGATVAPAATGGAAGAAAQASPAPSGDTRDACALVTEKEATAFLGSDPGLGTSTSTDTGPVCSYGGALEVIVQGADGVAQFGLKKSSVQGLGGTQTFTGVGDDAFATIVANTIADMEILKGSTLLSILVQGDPSLQNITPATLRALGTLAVGRL